MAEPVLSIVLVTWNTRDLTRACLESLRAEHPRHPREIIVVDNASADGTAAMIGDEFPDVTLIANPENLLYAEANNQGARAARGPYLCILNSDTEVMSGALDRLIDFLETQTDYAVVGPQLLNSDGSVQWSCNRFLGLLDLLLMWTFLGRFPPGSWWTDRSTMVRFDHQRSRDVEQIMGACLVLRRREFLDIGGFDPALSLYFNDHDLCRRFLSLGKRSRFLAEAKVTHHRGESTKIQHKTNVLQNRNKVAYFGKYYGLFGRACVALMIYAEAAYVSLRVCLNRRPLADKRRALREVGDGLRRIYTPAP